MKKYRFAVWVVTVVALTCAAATHAAYAQDQSEAEMKAWMKAGAPGAHHADFKNMVGTWDANISSWMAPDTEPMTSQGKVVYKLVMGGRYLQQEMTSTMMGMPFEGMGLSGYDNVAKKHTMVWIDNMSTQVTSSLGDCKDHCHYEEHHSTMLSPTGETVGIRMVTTIKDKDTHTFEFFTTAPGGSEFRSMEIVYTRSS